MKKTIFPYLLLIFFGTQTVIAQLSTEVNLPSPEASSIAKYVNFPISYFTGTVDVSVPIYTIKQGGLNVPISLNYHGGGVKKDEHPGWVGMGWSLSANYQVTRQKSSGGNPDIFYYSTPHGSGKFYENMNRTVDDLDASIDYEAVTLQVYNKDTGCSSGSYCNYEYDGQLPEGMSQSDYGGIKITFADGTRYYFGRKIGTNGPVIVDTSEDFFGTGCSVKRHDTWHLVRIEAMDEDNFIDFEYELSPYNTCSFSPYFGFLENTYKTVSLQCAEQGAPPPYMLRQSYAGYSGRITKPYYLKKIHFNSGSLDFETSASTQLKYPFGDIYVQSEASTGCQYPN